MKKATNSALMRIKNEKIILSLINKGPVSRVDISKKTGLTKAAVTIIVDDLKQREIVTEQNSKTDTVGRNPVLLHLNEKAFYIIGVNITRRDITVGITDLGGNIVDKAAFPVCPPECAFGRIKEVIARQIYENGIDFSDIYKLSVTTPGPIDDDCGMILNPPNFKEWHNVAVREELKKLTGLETVLQNVSSATAIAEKYFGAAFGCENFLVLRVDEGIGSGIFIDDILFKGPCELGHTSIKYDGEKCECGNRGCLEKYAAIPRLLKNSEYTDWRHAVDSNAEALLEKEAGYLSAAIISANNIFRFEKIVLCGELTYKPEMIATKISGLLSQNMLSQNEFTVCAGTVKSKLKIAVAPAINDFFV